MDIWLGVSGHVWLNRQTANRRNGEDAVHIGGIWSSEAIPSRGHWTFTADRLRLHLGSYVTTVHDEQCLFAIEGQMYDASVPVALERPEHLQTAYGYYAYVRYDKL